MRIRCATEGFPPATISNSLTDLSISWDDLLWAALTVGRPNRQYVFKYGASSFFEALFRLSMVRMALEQGGPGSVRYRRTAAAKTLDPSEKSAVSYFLGLVVCKAFATRLLNVPWLLHLDVFRPQLDPVLVGRSRPDLVGQENGTNQWHAFECKGRITPPNALAKAKAKEQAQRLVSVNGVNCSLHVGAITHFRGDALEFYWRDPPPRERDTIRLTTPDDAWREYYSPVTAAVERAGVVRDYPMPLSHLEEADVDVGIHPRVAVPLANHQWEAAYRIARESRDELQAGNYYPDGIIVKAGASWQRRLADAEEVRGL